MKKVLNVDNIIPAALLAFLSWVGLNAVSSNEAIATLQQSQQEDARVNQIVYQFEKVLPKIDTQLITIQKGVSLNAMKIESLRGVQQDTNSRIYCISTFPEGEDRKYCIKELTGE